MSTASTIWRLRNLFGQHGTTDSLPHDSRPYVTTRASDRRIQLVQLQSRLLLAAETADEVVGVHNQRISAQTVKSCLREAGSQSHQ